MSTDTPTRQERTATERDRDYRPIPENWAKHGAHESMGRLDARVYAVAVAYDEARRELHVRYVHPTDPGALTRVFDAVDADGSVVPEIVWERGAKAFPVSFGLGIGQSFAIDDDVREGERKILVERYADYLAECTGFGVDDLTATAEEGDD